MITGHECTKQPDSPFLSRDVPCPPVAPGGLNIHTKDIGPGGISVDQEVTLVLTQATVRNTIMSPKCASDDSTLRYRDGLLKQSTNGILVTVLLSLAKVYPTFLSSATCTAVLVITL